MYVNNKLTSPGDIRRVDIHPDSVRVVLQDYTNIVYRRGERVEDGPAFISKEEVSNDFDNG